MEKGQGKGTDTLQTDNVFTRKEYIERELAIAETRKPRLTDAELRRRLANIPAADVVPVVHGKWETAFLAHEYFGCRPYAHYCSVCNQIIAFRTFYCPNCGARMDGGEE